MPQENKEITNADLAKSIEALTQTVGGLAEGQKSLNQTVGDLVEGQKSLNQTVGDLVEGQKSLNQKFESLTQTVENLAIMTSEKFERVDNQIKLLAEGQELMRADIHDIKSNLGPIAQTNIIQEREIDDLKDRVSILEQKVAV